MPSTSPRAPVAEAPVIVTGATGWLGRRLVAALLEGDPGRPGRCLVHGAAATLPAGAVAHPGDLTDRRAAAELLRGGGGATVFHCAGVIHPRRVRELHAVNVEGTGRLVEAAQAAGVRRFIHLS